MKQAANGRPAESWRTFLEDWGKFRVMQDECEALPVVQAWRAQQAAAWRRREKKRWRGNGAG